MTAERHWDPWARRGSADEPVASSLLFGWTSRASSDWPRSAAFEWARHQLDRLERDLAAQGLSVPSLHSQQRMMAVLKNVIANDSVYPTITYDGADDELVAEWRAGRRRITIEISGTGEVFYSVRASNGASVYAGTSSVQVRRHLRDMTTTVANSNPNWRALFRDVRA